jgi:protein-tyrosine-phosphatase
MYISTEVHQGVTVTSAGRRPKPDLHPNTVRVLRETFGIDVSGQRPQHLDSLAGHAFDYATTLCDKAREICPESLHHTRGVHWDISRPGNRRRHGRRQLPGLRARRSRRRLPHQTPAAPAYRRSR